MESGPPEMDDGERAHALSTYPVIDTTDKAEREATGGNAPKTYRHTDAREVQRVHEGLHLVGGGHNERG